jgi:hypothetical protein
MASIAAWSNSLWKSKPKCILHNIALLCCDVLPINHCVQFQEVSILGFQIPKSNTSLILKTKSPRNPQKKFLKIHHSSLEIFQIFNRFCAERTKMGRNCWSKPVKLEAHQQ